MKYSSTTPPRGLQSINLIVLDRCETLIFQEVTSGLNSLVIQVDQEIDTIKLAINQLVL